MFLREADREIMSVMPKRHNLSVQAIYNWHKHCGDLLPVNIKRSPSMSPAASARGAYK